MKKRIKSKSKSSKNSKTKQSIRQLKPAANPYYIFLRYLILLCLMFSLPILYSILTPLTMEPYVYFLKVIFLDIKSANDMVIINNSSFIQIIPACIAGSAYLLLLILNLSVSMNLKKRVLSLLFSFAVLLLINITRLIVFSYIYVSNKEAFYLTHKFFWYFLSTVFVIAIWFFTVKIFSIKNIPVYTDVKDMIESKKK